LIFKKNQVSFVGKTATIRHHQQTVTTNEVIIAWS